MADQEKVIEMLGKVSCFFKSLLAVGWQCDADTYREYLESVNMAIALLKEQEPVKPKWASGIKGSDALCGSCWAWLFDHSWTYCPRCGRKVRWDD